MNSNDGHSAPGRSPDFRLSVKHRKTGKTNEVGSAWLSHDGSINIHLNPCVVLHWDDEVFIKLFPPRTT